MFPRTATTLALLLLALPPAYAAPEDAAHFFEAKVRPLLVERCYECHSPEKKVKGGLRLDTREGWELGGDSGPAIMPGEPDKSIFIEAIRYKNHDLQMPPKKQLAAEEVSVFEQWIKMGAPDPRTGGQLTKKQEGMSLQEGREFWCYKAVQKPAVPAIKDSAWPRGDLDRFILAAQEAAGLKPGKDAAPEVLARRLYFSLIGLPPTPEQSAEFVRQYQAAGDQPERAIATAVDQLLGSQHFGEEWSRRWLDLARFAESSGGGRTLLFKDAWRYRDYVIEALNADMPFDRFVQEQIAGDLLPAETAADKRRLLTATAFLALGPTNYEEQDKQQLRFDVIDEQLDLIGRSLLAQTIGCARCHDHKFDPVSQRDYYAMAGILASTRTLFNYTDNVARWISIPLPAEGEQEKVLREYEGQIAMIEKELAAAKATLALASKALSEPTQKPGMTVAKADLPGIVIDDSEAKVVGEWTHSRHVRSYIGDGYLHDASEGKGTKTITFTPMLAEAGKYEVRLAYAHAGGRANNVRVTVFHADGEDNVYVDQTQVPPIDGRFISLGKFRFEKDGAGYVLVTNEATKGFVTVDALQLLGEKEITDAESRTEVAEPVERREARKLVKELEAKLKALRKDGPSRETTMAVRDDDKVEDVQIRIRGLEKQRGESVPRGVMQVALRSEAAVEMPGNESGRRQLAGWIASADNPLTARVFVNRVWSWLFGSGIVRTVDNFGTTGEKPSHPELLDYLTARFVEEGWSIKKLVREMVLSRTWQLASQKVTDSDPENRLYTHANRRRLDAEQMRDAMLSVSGVLDQKIGGPNIDGAADIDANTFSAQNVEYGYVFKDTRRSIYTPAFRNKRLEFFEVFDFGDINQPVGQRNVSTVAPQALFLLNHEFVLEQSRAAAKRIFGPTWSVEERIATAFQRTLGRQPGELELQKCRQFVEADASSAEVWAQFQQTLFACVDFRYVD
jgi:hypothetical protein